MLIIMVWAVLSRERSIHGGHEHMMRKDMFRREFREFCFRCFIHSQ